MNTTLQDRIQRRMEQHHFSGSIYVKSNDTDVLKLRHGYANRSDLILNQWNTRYGIASGSKLFTAIAICQLVDIGEIQFNTTINECLGSYSFPHFDPGITVHQLLTHTSGIPDYFDEDLMEDFEELWIKRPMYHIRHLEDFLPMFQNEQMKHSADSKFHYNNAGYIMLGLIVEKVSQMAFQEYVAEHIFAKAGMNDSGYFEMDALPDRTALGYIDTDQGYRTNIYSLPARGGSDGGAYVTVDDMMKLCERLLGGSLLSTKLTELILTPHVEVSESTAYGYGLWMTKNQDMGEIEKYVLMGYDPGINFRALIYPDQSLYAVVCSNQSDGAYEIISEIEKELTSK
ncbi:serine hydrolase domain-containing protein [Paenibacillus provencensis]|uniref:Serine hydrolase domain-containing protein n=1 Tax=Paenibacillus provencensis TaxID=441151 RepID=A0ABW3PRI2_9BACL|nr:serine hydrolase domain-containing protein [Paenibacillus sp. MER 78]MCM3126857.1 beta-lactamase family protein [Paenibacillus sp. MER 78]